MSPFTNTTHNIIFVNRLRDSNPAYARAVAKLTPAARANAEKNQQADMMEVYNYMKEVDKTRSSADKRGRPPAKSAPPAKSPATATAPAKYTAAWWMSHLEREAVSAPDSPGIIMMRTRSKSPAAGRDHK